MKNKHEGSVKELGHKMDVLIQEIPTNNAKLLNFSGAPGLEKNSKHQGYMSQEAIIKEKKQYFSDTIKLINTRKNPKRVQGFYIEDDEH